MQIDTSGPRGKGMQRSTSGVTGQEVKGQGHKRTKTSLLTLSVEQIEA